jgi:membrane-associated HD superfamily phosphohydrolase
MFVINVTNTNIALKISVHFLLRILNINNVRKTLIGINKNDKTVSSASFENKMVITIPIKKKISMFTFFLRLKPVEYIMPRKLTNDINTKNAVVIKTIEFSISLSNLNMLTDVIKNCCTLMP